MEVVGHVPVSLWMLGRGGVGGGELRFPLFYLIDFARGLGGRGVVIWGRGRVVAVSSLLLFSYEQDMISILTPWKALR